MDNQPQQRFCTTCGQPLAPGAAFCVACGTQVSAPPMGAPGQFPAGGQPGFPPPYAQAPTQGQDDLLIAGLVAGSRANRMGRNTQRRARRRGSRLRGCGCLLLVLALIAGPFIGLAFTSGRLHMILTYVAGGMVALFLLAILIGMLATRRGRETLAEGCGDGCLDTLLGGG
jgi:zinc-ribbon domain